MDIILLIAYAALLILQIVLLVHVCRKPSKPGWTKLLLHELRALLMAVLMAVLFNMLPGRGSIPGMTWFAEFMYSAGAAAVYILMMAVTLVLKLVKGRK